jgi:hypothetical protein
MFAVYAARPNPEDPLASLVVGDRPEAEVPDGWVRVKISHASLNRHDLFTLRGITAQPDPIPFPMILGNDGAGTLDDGTPVVIYPVMGSDDWRDDETLDPGGHILSERVPGTFSDYVAVPKRNAIPLPSGMSLVTSQVVIPFERMSVSLRPPVCEGRPPNSTMEEAQMKSKQPAKAARDQRYKIGTPAGRHCWNAFSPTLPVSIAGLSIITWQCRLIGMRSQCTHSAPSPPTSAA